MAREGATGDALVAALDAMKDRKEPATIGGQAAVLAAIVRFVDAMIAVSDLAANAHTLKKIEAAQNAMALTMDAVRDALSTLEIGDDDDRS